MSDNTPADNRDSAATLSTMVVDDHLSLLHVRPRFVDYLRSLWSWRHFIAADARSKAFQGNQEMILGNLWLILTPLIQTATYGLIFGLLLRTSRGIDNFVGYLVIGVIFFGFISKGLSGGSGLIQKSRNLVQSFHFPRVTVAFGLSIRQMLDNILPAVVALIVALSFQWGQPPSWTLIFVPVLFVLIHIFAAGLTMIIARITAFIPDVKPLLAFVIRVLFYTSGIFFSIERFATSPPLQAVMTFNPAYQFLKAVRDSTLYATPLSLGTWATLLAWSFGTFIVGLVFFWAAEEKYVHV